MTKNHQHILWKSGTFNGFEKEVLSPAAETYYINFFMVCPQALYFVISSSRSQENINRWEFENARTQVNVERQTFCDD